MKRLALAVLVLCAACTKEGIGRRAASDYFSAAMAHREPYKLGGVSGYDVRAFEIVQVTPDIVAVRVTFAGKLGNDVVRTMKFQVANGKLKPTNREDIRAGILANLRSLSNDVGMLVLEDDSAENPITYARLKASKYAPLPLESVEGEDYSQIEVKRIKSSNSNIPDFEISLRDAEGVPVIYRDK